MSLLLDPTLLGISHLEAGIYYFLDGQLMKNYFSDLAAPNCPSSIILSTN